MRASDHMASMQFTPRLPILLGTALKPSHPSTSRSLSASCTSRCKLPPIKKPDGTPSQTPEACLSELCGSLCVKAPRSSKRGTVHPPKPQNLMPHPPLQHPLCGSYVRHCSTLSEASSGTSEGSSASGYSRRCSTSSCPASLPPLELSGLCTLASGPAKEAARLSRHRAAMQRARHLVRSACRIQSKWRQSRAARNVALIRMIFTEARKRHQARPSFQKRLAEQEDEEAQGGDGQPTLWKLRQSPQILREVLLDVLGAVKSCTAVDFLFTHHNDCALRRQEVHARWRRHSFQLAAIGILNKQLSNARVTESEWCKLSASVEP